MDIRGKKAGELAGIEFACQCGMTHKVDIEKVSIGAGMLPIAAAWVNHLDCGKVILVYDEVIAGIAGDALRALLPGSEAVVLENRHKLPLAPDESNIGELLVRVPADAGFLLAVGSGVINDLTRHVSCKMGIPYAVFATAPSMDGYASVTSSLIIRNIKQTIPGQMPKAIFADTAILGAAPADMLAAGFGDVLGKRNAIREWHFARDLLGEHYCPVMADLVMDAVALCEAHAEGLPNRETASVEAVMEALVLAGMVMGMYRNTRPASGAEHHMVHYWDVDCIRRGVEHPLHGISVGVGTGIACRLYDCVSDRLPVETEKLDADEIEAMLKKAGCPVLPTELGISEELFREGLRKGHTMSGKYTILTHLAMNHPDWLEDAAQQLTKHYYAGD